MKWHELNCIVERRRLTGREPRIIESYVLEFLAEG
jgi:hypothetical protein